jgi:hypothetical protein
MAMEKHPFIDEFPIKKPSVIGVFVPDVPIYLP